MTDHFTVPHCVSLSSIKKGSHAHVVGICGVAMAQIALELLKLGFTVSGSDKEFYEPMGGLLKKSPIKLYTGYKAENISDTVDFVVIGNAISADNPEVAVIKDRKLPYTIFPKVLSDLVISDRFSIVVTGTHGKSTTSALGASVLLDASRSPSFFIGGVVKGLPSSLTVADGTVSIVEGDEYDSAFFAKVPKFYFYRADCLIITSIEFDHADIYSSLEQIESVFYEAAKKVPESGFIVACVDCENVRRLVKTWNQTVKTQIITYGFHEDANVRIVNRTFHEGTQSIEIQEGSGVQVLSNVPLLGKHNARNAIAIFLASRAAGLSLEQIEKGLQSFKGVKRRQDIRLHNEQVTIIEDFAHHPTAVKETLAAIKEGYPERRIVCLFEPRSNTSRRKVFEEDYGKAFTSADVVIIKEVTARHNDAGIVLMDISTVVRLINESGTEAKAFQETNQIVSFVVAHAKPKDVIVVMSNGSFDGIIDTLISKF